MFISQAAVHKTNILAEEKNPSLNMLTTNNPLTQFQYSVKGNRFSFLMFYDQAFLLEKVV